MAQLDNDRMTEVTKDLRDTQAKLLEVIPKLIQCQGCARPDGHPLALFREVVGLNVFSVGGVIMRGDKMMDVVPDRDSLIVEAQIAVDDIAMFIPTWAPTFT